MRRAFPSRRRRPTIRRQLLAIVLIPSISLLAVALAVTGYLAYEADQARSLQGEVRQASRPAAAAILGLQEERRLTVAQPAKSAGPTTDLTVRRHEVDAALADLTRGTQPLQMRAGATAVQHQIGDLTTGAKQLVLLRRGVDAGQVSPATAYFAYGDLIAAFGASLRAEAGSAPDARAAYDQLTAVDLFDASESLSRSTTLAEFAFAGGDLPERLSQDYTQQVGAYHAQLSALLLALPPLEQAQLATIMKSPAWDELTRVEGSLSTQPSSAGVSAPEPTSAPAKTSARASAAPVGALAAGGQRPAQQDQPATVGAGEASVAPGAQSSNRAVSGPSAALVGQQITPADQAQWGAAAQQVSQALARLYAEHAAGAAGYGESTVRRSLVRAWIVGLVLLGVGIGVVWVALRLTQRVVFRLRALRDDTIKLSETRLPRVVEQLRRGDDFEVIESIPALDYGADEIGEVAEAFNHAQQMAVRAAVDEATARAGTRAVFLNIARRSQVIAYQQLSLLDRAEQRQEDPSQLSLLFELDHLATRARRHAENLVILGGKQPGRRWSSPVPLVDVVRGAIAETEKYAQVAPSVLPNLSVVSNMVADLIHILAELIDNATAFAPPTARAEVRGNVVGRGVVLEIEDQGLGIAAERREELNERLHKVPDFSDVALSTDTRLGLFVVGQLSARHGIKVTLRESYAYGGTRAVVLIPTSCLAPAIMADAGAEPVGRVVASAAPVSSSWPVTPRQYERLDHADHGPDNGTDDQNGTSKRSPEGSPDSSQ